MRNGGPAALDPLPASAQSCRTDFALLAKLGEISLVHCRLYTGRLHQIRATLLSLGFPVVGDRLYGIDETLYLKFIKDEETESDRARLRMNRTALHCRRLVVPHPRGDKRVSFVSPLPIDMKRMIDEPTV